MKSIRIPATAMAWSLACALLVPAISFGAGAVHSAALTARNLKDSDFPRWQKIAPDVYAYEGLHSPDKDGTVINTVSLIVVTTDGVTIVDGQGDVKQAQQLVDNVKKLTAQPIKNVVIASDHGDHTGGNAAFKAAYPEVVFISSPASQKTLAKNANPPTVTVADKQVLTMGKTEIQILNLGRAHTGGDLVVYLPQTKVLFMSEVYLRDVFPAMRTAYPSEWLATIAKAQALNATWYLPGHGFVDDAATLKHDLEDSRQALIYVIGEAKRLRAAGYACESGANCPAAAQAKWGPYGDWALSKSQGAVAIAKVYQEIDGKLPN